jgi:DNA-binding response OmpR family regulator
MKGTVLIIEDEPQIADLIAMYIQKEGINPIKAKTGEEGLELFTSNKCDLVILDINLPIMDGFEVLQNIRKQANVPVIIVSARQEDEDMIMGFGIGADDYVSKPFSPKVLVARIRAHLKRNKNYIIQKECSENQLLFGLYILDTENLWLKKAGTRIDLPPKEMSLLLELAKTPEKPRTQEDLYNSVWNNNYGDITTVSVHIQRLRKKIEKDAKHPQIIKTAYGFGYYLSLKTDTKRAYET